MATTKLILTHDVPNLGHAGEVVEVKAGYARNYLVPAASPPSGRRRAEADRPDPPLLAPPRDRHDR